MWEEDKKKVKDLHIKTPLRIQEFKKKQTKAKLGQQEGIYNNKIEFEDKFKIKICHVVVWVDD